MSLLVSFFKNFRRRRSSSSIESDQERARRTKKNIRGFGLVARAFFSPLAVAAALSTRPLDPCSPRERARAEKA